MKFKVKSGDGWFLEFVNGIGHFSTDPAEAALLSQDEALTVINRLSVQGFQAEMVRVDA